jgi:uncharacterized protein YkwD
MLNLKATRSGLRICRVFFTVAALLAAGCGVTPGGTPGGGSTSSVGASQLEQLSLERINRARLRPGPEAAANGITIDEGIPGQLNTTPKQPLAFNGTLIQIAREHSQDMLTRNYFDHNTPEGLTPFDRMTNAGYTFAAAGENIAWRGLLSIVDEAAIVEAQHVDLFVDSGIAGRGHRVNMLDNTFREVGIGIVRGNYNQGGTVFDSIMQTQDFGLSTTDSTFVLGVVYHDANHNGEYDFGEGVAGSTVTLGSTSKTTNAGGGYSFQVFAAGTYTLQFSPSAAQVINIAAGAPNIKVDLVDDTTIIVNLGLGALP